MSESNSANLGCFVESPKTVLIELTNKCNLECTICPRNDTYGKEMRKGSMKLDNALRLIDEITPYTPRVVLIGLGETLLYPGLLEVVRYIQNKNPSIELALTTNATLQHSAKSLSAIAQILKTAIMFSIDGTDEVYERIRIGGRYQRFITIASEVLKEVPAVSFSFNMVVCQRNYHHMIAVLELASMLGVKSVNFNSLNLAALPHASLAEYNFYGTQEFKTELASAKNRAKELGVMLSMFDFSTEGGFKKCTYPWDSFYITWDGFLVQCCAQPFPDLVNFGNVFEMGLMACINSPKFIELRGLWHRNATPQLCERCHKVRLPALPEISHSLPKEEPSVGVRLLSTANAAGQRRVIL